jgi:hypothetical protein
MGFQRTASKVLNKRFWRTDYWAVAAGITFITAVLGGLNRLGYLGSAPFPVSDLRDVALFGTIDAWMLMIWLQVRPRWSAVLVSVWTCLAALGFATQEWTPHGLVIWLLIWSLPMMVYVIILLLVGLATSGRRGVVLRLKRPGPTSGAA